ncbi:hypothetical protein E8E12_002894 [Didymella heteroderae]|uniref:BTB domain-containing protein n=1 Tax=Didymella heteroderae TaxID=1769908 RepID=A0A9P4WMG7_9PLEO|nr:hypothetical protein E8E12_002894 [Didymella heteroderae]
MPTASGMTFYRNARCEVLQPDGHWYRSTIESGPYVGDKGAAYYRVQIHHPTNRHDMVWAISIRPAPKYDYDYDLYYNFPQPSVPHVYPTSPAHGVAMPAVSQSIGQFKASGGGSSGSLAPLAPTVQPVTPSKRPLEPEQQEVASAPSAKTIQPRLPNASESATIVSAATPTVATVAEPPAKRQALRPTSNTSTASSTGQVGNDGSPTHKMPAPGLLEGPTIKVQVKGLLQSKIWHLPQALVSHHSPFFGATLRNMANASSTPCIELNSFEPNAFATLVHWMYSGTYDPQHGAHATFVTDHIDAWVLGDKIKIPVFQNLAISCIFSLYTGAKDYQPLTTSAVKYVCAKTTNRAPLRLLYLDMLAQNFTNQARVKGKLEDWDMALQEYPDARLAILGSFRAQGSRLKPKEEYLVVSGSSVSSRETRSTKGFEAGRLQINLSALPRIKLEIKKEPDDS